MNIYLMYPNIMHNKLMKHWKVNNLYSNIKVKLVSIFDVYLGGFLITLKIAYFM